MPDMPTKRKPRAAVRGRRLPPQAPYGAAVEVVDLPAEDVDPWALIVSSDPGTPIFDQMVAETPVFMTDEEWNAAMALPEPTAEELIAELLENVSPIVAARIEHGVEAQRWAQQNLPNEEEVTGDVEADPADGPATSPEVEPAGEDAAQREAEGAGVPREVAGVPADVGAGVDGLPPDEDVLLPAEQPA